ncbi:hypothetical protein RBA41_00860 [Massilia sp. CCM 9210]|uniref:hypothetical protein n=1 Tax=Massilia scottii TaxID=3057166 RepID=UPI002796C12A|nr:hypothetical protein [Massilia sp. CCM 9210]MDQ1811844.1 hypothetical protein [Massilia sp. CCM 9210]
MPHRCRHAGAERRWPRPGGGERELLHASGLIASPENQRGYQSICLEKEFGATRVVGMRELEKPAWHWTTR